MIHGRAMFGKLDLQWCLRRLLVRVLLLITGLGVLAGQAVAAIEVAVLFPGQASAASFTIEIDRAVAAFRQVGHCVRVAQTLKDRRTRPDVREGLAPEITSRNPQLNAGIDLAVRADQARRQPNLARAS